MERSSNQYSALFPQVMWASFNSKESAIRSAKNKKRNASTLKTF